MKKLPLVEVTWTDSKMGRVDWDSRKAYRRPSRSQMKCRSAGYLLRDKGGIVTLVQSQDRGFVSGSVHIPKVSVLSVRGLRSDGGAGG